MTNVQTCKSYSGRSVTEELEHVNLTKIKDLIKALNLPSDECKILHQKYPKNCIFKKMELKSIQIYSSLKFKMRTKIRCLERPIILSEDVEVLV